jgi:NAD(P)H-hydrate epimerase
VRPEAGSGGFDHGWPSFLEPLPDAHAMRDGDRWAIETHAIPSLELMERAGAALAHVVAALAPAGVVAAVCGGGNNGGDGLVAARRLRDAGRNVRVLLLAEPSELGGDPKENLTRLAGAGADPVVEPFRAERLADASCIVDCILGTGFSGEPRPLVGTAIEAINAAAGVVIAADVPSGVDASTGEVPTLAVRARATVTFTASKPGLWIHPGKAHAGDVHVVDIGIPEGAPVEFATGLVDASVIELLPTRGPGSTKFTSGQVLVCGGSRGLTGAPILAATAAMRAGAGYVIVCLPEALEPALTNRPPELMTLPLPNHGAAAVVLARATRGAMVVGPGLGREPEVQNLARELARDAKLPLVLDADGLNAHAGGIDELAARSAPTILTPHEGELARLLDLDAEAITARRLHHAREAASRSGAVVLLKGDDTIVARPDGVVGIVDVSAPALATAGTGDVLSGVLAAILAKGVEPFVAACAGARLHAVAGRLAAEAAGSPEGVIASDVIAMLPRARAARLTAV